MILEFETWKYETAFCEELVLEEAMELSQDRLLSE
jgi:hypothetical protein